MKTLNIEGYGCQVATQSQSSTICYMIYPALEPFEDKWLEKMAAELSVNLVMVYVPAEKWNDALTPWPEPGEAKGCPPFAGKAKDFLDILQHKIIPGVEEAYNINDITARDLLGVSLSGLFTFWQWMICDTFRNIASLSGSFWYLGFIEWFEKQNIPSKTGKAYFLLGEEEPHAHVKAFQSVGVNTLRIVDTLKEHGLNVTFEWVPGNHFSRPVHRAEKALSALYAPQ